MRRNAETIAFANLLGETFPDAASQRAFERDVVKLLAFAERLKAREETSRSDPVLIDI